MGRRGSAGGVEKDETSTFKGLITRSPIAMPLDGKCHGHHMRVCVTWEFTDLSWVEVMIRAGTGSDRYVSSTSYGSTLTVTLNFTMGTPFCFLDCLDFRELE